MYRTFFKSQSSLTPLPALLRCPAPSAADKAALPLADSCAAPPARGIRRRRRSQALPLFRKKSRFVETGCAFSDFF